MPGKHLPRGCCSLVLLVLPLGYLASTCCARDSFKVVEANWADDFKREDTCGLLASLNVATSETKYSPILIRNAVQLVPELFSNLSSLSFALGASRGKVTVSQSPNFDIVRESTNMAHLKGFDQLRLRDMTLMEFQSRASGGWDPLYFANEFYLFSGRLPQWLRQGKFQDAQPLACLKANSCLGCGRKQGGGAAITSASFQVTTKGSIQALRYETRPTIMLVTAGETLMQLVSPKDIAGLKPYERSHPLYRRSSLSFEEVAKKLDYVEVIVRPGDALILDAYTAHQTHSIDDTISFSYSIRK